MLQKKYAILIAGPTASGKSVLAARLAADLGGVVINADSMQVYRDLAIITARPSEEEMQGSPHALYGVLEGAKSCSAADWSILAMQEAESAWQKDLIPIFVGGTGLYLKFLIDGVADIPDIPAEIRQAVRDELATKGAAVGHARLVTLDPVTAARLSPNDSQRIARALEVVQATGKPLSDWQKNNKEGPLQALDEAGLVYKIVIDIEREALYARCDMRFDQMLEAGALTEVETLLEKDLDKALPVMKSLGVPQLAEYLQGKSSLEDAADLAKMQTRRFAKRQTTWFNNQFNTWDRVYWQYNDSKYTDIRNIITKNMLTK